MSEPPQTQEKWTLTKDHSEAVMCRGELVAYAQHHTDAKKFRDTHNASIDRILAKQGGDAPCSASHAPNGVSNAAPVVQPDSVAATPATQEEWRELLERWMAVYWVPSATICKKKDGKLHQPGQCLFCDTITFLATPASASEEFPKPAARGI